jgi:GH43 family beta-xylosidase
MEQYVLSTRDVSRGEAKGNMGMQLRVHKTNCFPEVSVINNKYFIIYTTCQRKQKETGNFHHLFFITGF